jgi:hypothetical protein
MTQTTATRERPILFSGPMIRAILDARKTQTRRVVKPQPVHIPEGPATTAGWLWPPGAEPGEDGAWWGDKSPPNSPAEAMGHCCPYGQPGDRLWVRETFSAWFHGCHWSECTPSSRAALSNLFYRATHPYPDDDQKWIPSIHMPRWASRITLEIAGVRVERLNEITGRDARSEGCEPDDWHGGMGGARGVH